MVLPEPFALLQQIDERNRDRASGLPRRSDVQATWSGIGFRLGSIELVANLNEVKEILTYPPLSRVPGTKPWVRGIANVRGNLLPVLDLKEFMERGSCVLGRSSRVLVVQHQGLFAGLLVDEVLGLRHFPLHESQPAPAVEGPLANYLRGGFGREGRQWGVLGLHTLAESPDFLQVAA